MKILMSLVLAFTCVASNAQYTEHLVPFGSAVTVLDKNAQNMGVAGYNNYPNGVVPWGIAQWGIGQEMVPAPGAASGWSIANGDAAVQFYSQFGNSSNVYQLAQHGWKCNNEMDLFLQPNGDGGFTGTAKLDRIGTIKIRVGVNVQYLDSTSRCAGENGVDSVQQVVTAIFSSDGGQLIFYQINLGNTRFSNPSADPAWCPEYENGQGNYFCLDDDVRNSGGAFINVGDVWNNFEFLPRILEVITRGHKKQGMNVWLDSDPSRWYFSGIYMGQIIQGKALGTSSWYAPGVSTMQGGNFCGGATRVQFVCNQGAPSGPGWVAVSPTCYHRDTGKSCS